MEMQKSHDGMHYTVVLTLMISVITTFLLGVLLTEAMFNPGLNYFSGMKETIGVNKTRAAALMAQQNQQFKPPIAPAPSLNLSNTLYSQQGTGMNARYTFRSLINNNGTTEFKKIGFTYTYDKSVLELVTTSNSIFSISEKQPTILERLLKPNIAHAQVSIDFPPFPPKDPSCVLDSQSGMPICEFGSIVDTLAPGMTWGFDLQFKRANDELSLQPTVIERFFNWITGTKKAQGQVSIDFPTLPASTETTATIPYATDINNWQLTEPIVSTAIVTL